MKEKRYARKPSIPERQLNAIYARDDWEIRYYVMCEYLDEIEDGNLEHLDDMIDLVNLETSWCSHDKRLSAFTVPLQEYKYDSDGLCYETQLDVEYKTLELKRWLKKIKGEK
jgi:hypothetical protein